MKRSAAWAVAVTMVAGGAIVLAREHRGMPVRGDLRSWLAIIAGAVVIVLAFCWDFRNIMGGGRPVSFAWALFASGDITGIAGLILALRGTPAPAAAAVLTDDVMARRAPVVEV